MDQQHPPVYRSINWGEFRSKRYAGGVVLPSTASSHIPVAPRTLQTWPSRGAPNPPAGDYADLGEEVQISHYRLDKPSPQQQQQQQQAHAGGGAAQEQQQQQQVAEQ